MNFYKKTYERAMMSAVNLNANTNELHIEQMIDWGMVKHNLIIPLRIYFCKKAGLKRATSNKENFWFPSNLVFFDKLSKIFVNAVLY